MSFTIISYNIWFQMKDRRARTIALGDILKKSNADVICLQEVTANVLTYLKHILEEYKYMYPNEISSYGDVIFSKHEIIKHEIYHYKVSDMGRNLKLITILINGKEINIASTHFESEFTEYNLIKRGQYQRAGQLLGSLDTVIFCTDTNISNDGDEEAFNNSFPDWTDTWKKHGTYHNEYTYDHMNNEYVAKKEQNYRSRLDRILYKGRYFISQTFDFVDTTDYPTPSDHMGITTRFEIIE
jgi:endonuclease/exonuclease/phosphatase family metal-dependent hydrolase